MRRLASERGKEVRSRPGGGGKSVGARVERGAIAVFGVLGRGANGPFRGPRKHLALQTRLTIAFSGGKVYVIGRSRIMGQGSFALRRMKLI